MRGELLAVCLMLGMAMPSTASAGNAQYSCVPATAAGTFIEVAVPNGFNTFAKAVNDAGIVVGVYDDASGWHSFVLDHGEYTEFTIAGATNVIVEDINSAGTIVGSFFSDTSHGFIWHDGRLITLDAPGARFTSPLDINDAGTVVGTVLLPGGEDGLERGFVYRKGQFEIVQYPDSVHTNLRSINDAGAIVGGASLEYSGLNFLWNRNAIMPIADCDGVIDVVQGITNQGHLFGQSSASGFILSRAGLTLLNRPEAEWTSVTDVNSAGLAVGSSYSEYAVHSFLYVPR